jgi:hypothetical protein
MAPMSRVCLPMSMLDFLSLARLYLLHNLLLQFSLVALLFAISTMTSSPFFSLMQAFKLSR